MGIARFRRQTMMFTRPFARHLMVASLLCATALSAPAYAGDQADAEAAIAVAKAKLAAGDKVGTNRQAPELQEQARKALHEAQDLLDNHHKKEALAAAVHAGELADQALVSGDNRKAAAEQVRRMDTQDSAIAAQQNAANADLRASSAQNAANAANLRADSAERGTLAAQAETNALRNAPPPAPTTTTLSVTHEDSVAPAPARKPVRRVKHKVVRKAAIHRTTTTTVTATHP
jgi:hypothetical protein